MLKHQALNPQSPSALPVGFSRSGQMRINPVHDEVQNQRATFDDKMAVVDPEHLVFVDEMGRPWP